MACLLLLMALLGADDAALERVTARNWEHHPRIEAAREVFQEVEQGLANHALHLRVRRAKDECWDWSEMRLAVDDAGAVRYFYREGGGQDSTHRHALYYDGRGTLRFARLQGGAVTMSSIDTRVWFDEAGKELYRRSANKGPGWTWMEGDADVLVRDPASMFKKGAGDCAFGPAREVPADTGKIDGDIEKVTSDGAATAERELRHWTFEASTSGALERISATQHEGSVVREESHYFSAGKLFAVDVLLFWDVDDAAKAPRPAQRRYYVSGTCTWRPLGPSKERSKPTACKPAVGAALTSRAQTVLKMVHDSQGDGGISTDALEEWPDDL